MKGFALAEITSRCRIVASLTSGIGALASDDPSMADATIHPIRPADQSALAHAQPLPPPIPLGYMALFDCQGLRVTRPSPTGGTMLHIQTADAVFELALYDLPEDVVAKAMAAFGDERTPKEE